MPTIPMDRPCGCCDPDERRNPRHNEPGLPAINYRTGTYGEFFRRMLRGLPNSVIETLVVDPVDPSILITHRSRPLRRLRTRALDDPSIALCDAWAVAADVLAFYQERIATEHYLGTAVERRSILELARLIGYELSPGVAASVHLAFTMEDAVGAPPISQIPAGTRVQSVPDPGDLPQSFETSVDLEARIDWNVLRPRLLRPQELAIFGDELFLLGVSTGVPEGVATLFNEEMLDDLHAVDPSLDLSAISGALYGVPVGTVYLQGTSLNLKAGEPLLLAGRSRSGTFKSIAKPVREIVEEPDLDRTRVVFDLDVPKLTFQPAPFAVAHVSVQSSSFSGVAVQQVVKKQSWKEGQLSAMLQIQGWSATQVVAQLSAPAPPPAEEGVFRFKTKAGTFGHNAPRWDSLPLNQRYQAHNENVAVPYPATSNWDSSVQGPVIGNRSNGTSHYSAFGLRFFAERPITEVPAGSWIVLENPSGFKAFRVSTTRDVSLADFAISAKATGFDVSGDGGSPVSDLSGFRMRSTTIHASNERVLLAPLPIDDDLEAAEPGDDPLGVDRLMLDRLVLGLNEGKVVIVSGHRVDAPAVEEREAATIREVHHDGGFTTLVFEKRLAYRYVRSSVRILANVVEATHGESVREVLGSGDPTKRNQQFVLKKPPLTYTRAGTPSGGASTLEVRVQGVEWEGVSSLFHHDGDESVYVVRHADDGTATVTFGDGTHGRRLPSGGENVRARYRSGIGLEGEVSVGSLTLLQTRPAPIRDVTNPLPASGAAEPTSRDAARERAPGSVRTLDRIVSLRDFEDFAASYGGIGKAHAAMFWNGTRRVVLLTVASERGESFSVDSPVLTGLRLALDAARDPSQMVMLERHRLELFDVAAEIRVLPRFDSDEVIAEAEASIRTAFAFGQREFGQPVTSSEVIAVLQRTHGVESVRLSKLHFTSSAPGMASALPAAPAHLEGGVIVRAQLVLVNQAGIDMTAMEA